VHSIEWLVGIVLASSAAQSNAIEELCNNLLITNYEARIILLGCCMHGAWFIEVAQRQLVS